MNDISVRNSIGAKVLIFDSHPVQYRAPIYRRIEQLVPGKVVVVYATDFSASQYFDPGFGSIVEWDEPLLSGYNSICLHCEQGTPLQGVRSLSLRGVFGTISKLRPAAILSTQFLYEYDAAVWMGSALFGIPLWIRQETQDQMYRRSRLKECVRAGIYRVLYSRVSIAFVYGELNRAHLTRFGVRNQSLRMTRFSTVDRIEGIEGQARIAARCSVRQRLGLSEGQTLVTFVGKLIPIKNPEVILKACELLPEAIRSSVSVLYVGSGELESQLRASAARTAVRSNFEGFKNQTELPSYYLATDILVLPSRSEAWGLVVNEALQAGCCVIVTSTVGCHVEFGNWERVRVVPPDSPAAIADAISALSGFERNFDWCREQLREYSIESNARVIASEVLALETAGDEASSLQLE